LKVSCSSQIPSEFSIRDRKGNKIRILTIQQEMAMHCYPVKIEDRDHLIFTQALVLQDDQRLELLIRLESRYELLVWPPAALEPEVTNGKITFPKEGRSIFTKAEIQLPPYSAEPVIREIQSNKYSITLPMINSSHINDLFLIIDYLGDTGMGFMDGELVADHFFNGSPWSIGLKRFTQGDESAEMVLYFRPLYEDPPYLQDLKSTGLELEEKQLSGFRLEEVKLIPEYRTEIIFGSSD
jgi:hypothetical protein